MFHNQARANLGAVEHVHHLVDAGVHGLTQESGVKEWFDFEGHVAENHRQGETLERACTRAGFAPFSLGIVHLGQDDVKGAARDVFVFLIARGEGQLSESDDCEGVGENIVGLYEGMTFAVEGEIPVELAIVAILFQKFCALDGRVEPLLALLHLIIKRGKHPYLAALQPNEFVGVEDGAIALKAGEISAILEVLRLLQPEGHDLVQ